MRAFPGRLKLRTIMLLIALSTIPLAYLAWRVRERRRLADLEWRRFWHNDRGAPAPFRTHGGGE
jgi:hypothetical protein